MFWSKNRAGPAGVQRLRAMISPHICLIRCKKRMSVARADIQPLALVEIRLLCRARSEACRQADCQNCPMIDSPLPYGEDIGAIVYVTPGSRAVLPLTAAS
jgi:hypothetical protein